MYEPVAPSYAESPAYSQQSQLGYHPHERKPNSPSNVYPVTSDTKRHTPSPTVPRKDRPDYRPLPLRWPFITTLILILVALMGTMIWGIRALGDTDTTATLENRGMDSHGHFRRQDLPEPTATLESGPTDAAEQPTDNLPSPTDIAGGGILTTALVESEYTYIVTEAGTSEVITSSTVTTETEAFTTEVIEVIPGTTVLETKTNTIKGTTVTLAPETSGGEIQYSTAEDQIEVVTETKAIQPPQTTVRYTAIESGVVRTVPVTTTRMGPPVTYAKFGTTTLYKAITIDSEGNELQAPKTVLKTSEVAATTKTIVDAPPPTTILSTLADGQVITSVSTPLPTTRTETLGPTRIIVTDVETPTGGTVIIEATTYELTDSAYFIGKFLPPILGVFLAFAIRALNHAAQQYQPLAALSRPGGALGREALTLSFDGIKAYYLPFKLFVNNQPLPLLTLLAVGASSIFAPLASEAVGLKIYGRCRKGAIDGCALGLGVSEKAAYALIGLLGLLAILLAVTLSTISRHWRTGVFANPWCLASAAALVARNPDVRSLAASDYPTLKDSVVDRRFSLGWYRNAAGRDEYGVVLLGVDDAGSQNTVANFNATASEGMAYRPHRRRRAPETFIALGFWWRFILLIFLVCLLGFISYYHFVGTYGTLPRQLVELMEGEQFGVRFIASSLGVIVIISWEFLFTSISVITPFRRMARNPQVPTRSVLMTPATNSISGLFVALRVRDPLLFVTAFVAVISQFLPILLANVPYNLTLSQDAQEMCARISIAVLLLMSVILFFTLFVRWPDLPCDPRSLAGAMWYTAEGPWVNGLEGVAAMSAKGRQTTVQGFGGRWTYGPFHTPQGQRMGVEHGNMGFRG